MDPENVVVVSLPDRAAAENLLAEVERLHAQKTLQLRETGVAERGADGTLQYSERAQPPLRGTIGGVAAGALLGLLGGPLGIVAGGAAGGVFGSVLDVAEAQDAETIVADSSRLLPPGHALLVVITTERTPDVLDGLVVGFGGKVVSRRPRGDVERDIAAAENEALASRG